MVLVISWTWSSSNYIFWQVFDTIAVQCDVAGDEVALPPKLASADARSFASQPDSVLVDLVDYLYDVCQTLASFLQVYAPASAAFHEQSLEAK